MSNIFTQPIVKTGDSIETDEYTQEITISNGDSATEVVSFPQCLAGLTEEDRKDVISSIMLQYMRNKQ